MMAEGVAKECVVELVNPSTHETKEAVLVDVDGDDLDKDTIDTVFG